jgi:hypothetical protein
MAHSIVLHIGPRKTGSTFLQRALVATSSSIAEAGILYPTALMGVDRHNHVSATYAIPGMRDGKSEDQWADVDETIVTDLARQVSTWQGDVILSSEALGGLTAQDAQRFLDRLPDVPIRVVATVRALPDVVLSSWAQHVRNLHRESLQTYVERRIRERPDIPAEERWARWNADTHATFWRSYDYPGLLSRWQGLGLPITAVIVPPSHAPMSELWSRFRTAAKLDGLPSECPTVDEVGANTSLRMEELEVVRRAAQHGLEQGRTLAQMRSLRGHRWMPDPAARPSGGTRPGLAPEHARVFETWAQVDADALLAGGSDIVGDHRDLLTPARQAEQPEPYTYAAFAGYLVADRVLAVYQRQTSHRSRLGQLVRRIRQRGARYSRAVMRRVTR